MILDLMPPSDAKSKIVFVGDRTRRSQSALPVHLVSLRRRHPRIPQVEIVRLADAELLHFLHLGL
jgi:hypothetical protein